MNVKKIMLLAGMALALVAFAAPAVAQAKVTLTENGNALKPGDLVTATSTNLQTTTALGLTLTCQKVTLHYEVEVNGLDHVVLQPTTAHNATAETCHVITPGGITDEVHISNAGTEELTINTWGTGEAASTFTSLITGVATCTFSGAVHVQATGGGGLNVGPSALTGPCGGGTIHGDFTMETPDANKTPITLDFVNTG